MQFLKAIAGILLLTAVWGAAPFAVAEATESAATATYCQTGVRSGTGTVSTFCSLQCPDVPEAGGEGSVSAAGGALGIALPQISGSNECGDITCDLPFACYGSGLLNGGSSFVACRAKNTSIGVAYSNIAGACYNIPTTTAAASGRSLAIWNPSFDVSAVAPGDLLCMPVDPTFEPSLALGAPIPEHCLLVGAESVVFFDGPASYYPVGVACTKGLCTPVEWL